MWACLACFCMWACLTCLCELVSHVLACKRISHVFACELVSHVFAYEPVSHVFVCECVSHVFACEPVWRVLHLRVYHIVCELVSLVSACARVSHVFACDQVSHVYVSMSRMFYMLLLMECFLIIDIRYPEKRERRETECIQWYRPISQTIVPLTWSVRLMTFIRLSKWTDVIIHLASVHETDNPPGEHTKTDNPEYLEGSPP